MKSNYIPCLDGVRAISVFLVLFSHAGLGKIIPGGLGVTVFFFLSGFLITTLLINEHKKTLSINYPYFFLRRFFRIFPPLILTLLVSYSLYFLGFLGGGISWEGLLPQVFFLVNYQEIFLWPGEKPDGLNVLWSLAVEEHFYVFFPLSLYFCLKKLSMKQVAVFLGFICVLILCWRIYLVYYEQVNQYRTYYGSDTRIDSILFGCILALYWNPASLEKNKPLNAKAIFLMFVSTILLLTSLLLRDQGFRETYRYSIQGVALISLFYYCIVSSEHFIFRWLNWTFMRKLGVYSYFIYLIHFVVINVIEKNQIVDSIVGKIILTSITCIIFSFFVDKYIDIYFRRIRKKFRA